MQLILAYEFPPQTHTHTLLAPNIINRCICHYLQFLDANFEFKAQVMPSYMRVWTAIFNSKPFSNCLISTHKNESHELKSGEIDICFLIFQSVYAILKIVLNYTKMILPWKYVHFYNILILWQKLKIPKQNKPENKREQFVLLSCKIWKNY